MNDGAGRFRSTPFAAVVRNILLAYVLFFICRIVFILNNWQYYDGYLVPEMYGRMLAGALRFDTAALCYICSPYIVLMLLPLHLKEKPGYYRFAKWVFIIFVMAGCIMNLVDCVYYPYSGNRTTIGVFREFGNDSNIGGVILMEVVHSWYITATGAAMLLVLLFCTTVPTCRKTDRPVLYYVTGIPVFLSAAVLSVVGIRGGWGSSHPISMNNASQYVNRPAEAVAVLNTPFCFIRTLGKEPVRDPHYFDVAELESIYTPVIRPDSASVIQKRNVVIFILESFGSEYIGALNRDKEGYRGYTPFLDSLLDRSLTFEHSYANGRKSIDGMPSVLSGLPMLGANLFLSEYAMDDMSGIAGELKNEGYYSAFFHGAENGSMGFQSFARATGYDDYFGMTEFCDDPDYDGRSSYDGLWAIWDEEFLQFFCDRMNGFPQPFVTTVFTASSHHPFKVPERYEGLFPAGEIPIHQCIGYSDYALRRFFEKASRQPWFANTLFVITADHTNQSARSEYMNDCGRFRVPVAFFDPSGELYGHRNAIIQQADIMPTVLGYLGYARPYVAFGQDMTSTPDSCSYALNYNNGIYQYMQDRYMLQFDGQKTTAMYDIVSDPALQNDISANETARKEEYERRVKAVIQQYAARMIENQLVVR